MRERGLLQIAHSPVGQVDRRGDPGAVAVLGFDRLRETGVVGAHLQLQRAPLHREPALQLLHASLLPGVERELVMEHVVKLRARLLGRGQERAPGEHPADRRQKSRDGQKAGGKGRRIVTAPPPGIMEGRMA